MKRDPIDGITLDVATGVIDHLDTMYPAALQAVPGSARVSLRNTIRAKVRRALLDDRLHQAAEGRPRRKLPLMPRQAQALDFIKRYIAEHTRAPSFQEIGDGIGMRSKSGVQRLVDGLNTRGHIRYEPNMPRTIEVLE